MIKDCIQEIAISDNQDLVNIRWNDYVLLIKVGEYEIQLGLCRPDTHYFLRLWAYAFPSGIEKEKISEIIDHIFSENKIMDAQCQKVQFILDNPFYTVIPESLFEDKYKDAYSEFLYGNNDNLIRGMDKVQSNSLRIVYGIDQKIGKDIAMMYSNFSIFHNQTILINSLEYPEEGKALYITLEENYVAVMAFSAGKLLLAQSYKTGNALDAVYHILNVGQNLEFKEETQLFFTGKNKYSDEVFQKLESRFTVVSWLERPYGCQFPDEIDQYPAHYFYHLVSLALCES